METDLFSFLMETDQVSCKIGFVATVRFFFVCFCRLLIIFSHSIYIMLMVCIHFGFADKARSIFMDSAAAEFSRFKWTE